MRIDAHARRMVRWAAWPLALLTLWASIASFRFSAAAIDYPFQLDPIESKLLQQALWIREGHPIYFRLGPEPPWVVGNYPPLYPLIAAPFTEKALPDFTALRILTLLGTIGAGMALAFAVARITGSIALGLLSAGLWWATWEVYHWTALARVDLLALGFAAWGFALGLTFKQWTWPRLLAVCALFWAAWMTRQTQVLLPLALVGGLLFADRRWAIRLGALWLTGLVVLFGVMMLWTRGAYWELVFLANFNETVPGQLSIYFRHLWRFQPFGLLALLTGVVGVAVHLAGVRRLRADVVALLFAMLLNAVNVLALAKVGADKNYLLEPQWCLAALLPVLWWKLVQIDGQGYWRGFTRGAAGLFTALLIGHVAFSMTARIPNSDVEWRDGWLPDRSAWRRPPDDALTARDLQVLGTVERADGPILSEYGIYQIHSGGEIIWEPFLATQMARQGLWDETPLIERVRAGEFSEILVEDDLMADGVRLSMSEAFAEAVRERYELVHTWPGTITQRLWVRRETD